MFARLKRLFSASHREAELQQRLQELRRHLPVPVFWLFGKTQSGKTSIIKYLTGADQAEIGKGFQPCTRFSRQYQFPSTDAPLVSFLDTRGLDEPGYRPDEDLALFGSGAHVLVVVAKVLDHAQENVLTHLRTIRRARPGRPVLLVLTCLHEAYPQQQHPQPYPWAGDDTPPPPALPEALGRSYEEQRRRFDGLIDRVVAVDLTPADEGFIDPEYGGPRLRQVLIEMLPAALRQSMLDLEKNQGVLQDFFARQAMPSIWAYSSLAATAGAVPVPLADLLLVSGVQSRMIYHLAQLYGQPLTAHRFLEIATTLGMGVLVQQTSRSLLKLLPGIGTVVGSVAYGVLAGSSTFALGQAFCYYYRAVHEGHVPQPEDLRRYYREQLIQAEQLWLKRTQKEGGAP
jgi:uncharacterized protein (DUF697 family)/predicted GTPase